MAKSHFSKRRQARIFALQAIYQWQLSGNGVDGIYANTITSKFADKMDQAYFKSLFFGVCYKTRELDQQFEPYLDRSLKEVAPIELAILRLSTYELTHHLEIPYRVVINEALELTKKFGGTDGHKFVNGIIDKLAKQVRMTELQLISG